MLLRKIVYGLLGVASGMYSMTLLPERVDNDLGNVIGQIVMAPIDFLEGISLFMVSFLMLSFFIRSLIEETYYLYKNNTISVVSYLFNYVVFGIFFILFLQNMEGTLMLFLFTVVYGMISVDFKKMAVKSVDY